MIFYKNTEGKLEIAVINVRGDFVSGLSITYKVF